MALQNPIAGQPNGIAHTAGLQELVDFGLGKSGVAPEELPHPLSPVAVYRRFQPLTPAVRAVHIARPEQRPFAVPELVKKEQWVVAHGLEMAVVGGLFLLAMHRALGAVHIQDDPAIGWLGLGPGGRHRWCPRSPPTGYTPTAGAAVPDDAARSGPFGCP